MAAKKKYKKLTNKEKAFNKEFKDRLREEGILPPVKAKLNRNKFAKEVIEEFKDFDFFYDVTYLMSAINYMTPSTDLKFRVKVSPEQIGVLKVMKIAMEIKKFEQAVKADGETKYKLMELYEKAIAPIINL